jgi:hypothetical protein
VAIRRTPIWAIARRGAARRNCRVDNIVSGVGKRRRGGDGEEEIVVVVVGGQEANDQSLRRFEAELIRELGWKAYGNSKSQSQAA